MLHILAVDFVDFVDFVDLTVAFTWTWVSSVWFGRHAPSNNNYYVIGSVQYYMYILGKQYVGNPDGKE